MPASTVLGCARHLPSRSVTTEVLAERIGVPAAEVVAVSGIACRAYAEPGIGPSDLGLRSGAL